MRFHIPSRSEYDENVASEIPGSSPYLLGRATLSNYLFAVAAWELNTKSWEINKINFSSTAVAVSCTLIVDGVSKEDRSNVC